MKKRKRSNGVQLVRMLCTTPPFIFLVVILLCGALAGSFTGMRAAQADTSSMEPLVNYVIKNAQNTWTVELIAVSILPCLAWQLAGIFSGMLRPHSLFISAVVAARGFSLAFSVSALVCAMHLYGLGVSFASSGIGALLGIPCLLLTGTAAFMAAEERPPGRRGGYL